MTNTLTTLTAAVAPPVDEMGVSDTLFLSAGNGAFAGSAHVSAFVNQFSEVAIPEASTWAMLGIGFAGLGFAGRRARKRTRALVL